MRVFRTSFRMAALASALSLSTGAMAYDVNEAMVKAYNSNPALKAARENLAATDELVSQAISGWRPNVSASYDKGRSKNKFGDAESTTFATDSTRLSIQQPVFNGFGTITATRSADANIVAERERLRGVEQDVLLQTITTYMDVVRDTAVLKLSENNVEVLGKQLQATNDRFAVGEVTKTDVAQSQARQSRAVSDSIQAEGNLISSTAQQEKLVGEKPVDLKMPEALPPIPATFEEAQAKALAANPLLTRATHLQKAAGHDSYTARSRILPTVAIVGEMRRDDSSTINRGSEYEDDSIVVNASIPLYQSGEEYSRIRQADRTNERRKEEANDTRNQVIQNITQAWQQVETARATIKSNTDAVKAAEIALDGVKQENQYGARTTLDVLDAEQELFQTRVNLVRAQRDEVVAVYTLLAATGDLSAKNLALPVQYYDAEKNYRRVKWKFIGW